jgi:hypothetical protein
LDRGALLGIIGGAAVFIILLSLILYGNTDFDVQLVDDVNNNVPVEKLIPKIDNETQILLVKVKRRYESSVNDRKFWGNGDLISSETLQYYTENYETDLKMINALENVRKNFARREISKKEFYEIIKQYKDYFNTFR